MSEKIIIDGIDVSECEFYCEEYCNLSNDRNERLPFAEKCTGYSDCCYKQLKRKEQECKEYADKVEYIHAFLKNPHNYGSFKPMWGSFLLHRLFNENLGDFLPQEAYEMTDTITEKEKQIIKYKQALDEIEENIKALNNECFYNDFCDCNTCDMKGSCSYYRKSIILNIINKIKGCK